MSTTKDPRRAFPRVSRAATGALMAASAAALLAAPASAQRRPDPWPAGPAAPTLAIEEVAIVGVGAATAALMLPADVAVRRWVLDAEVGGGTVIAHLDRALTPMGGPYPQVAAWGLWLVGLATGQDALADGALTVGEALLATTVVKGVAQRVIGRRRPFVEPHDPSDVAFGRGFGDRESRSFPSGHAANAFALAAALTEEMHHGGSGLAPWGGGIALGAATVTSLSRVVSDEHWFSDVVAGAALGALIGTVVADANGR